MTPEQLILERIKDLNTLAGDRVWMLKLPQFPQLPAVRVELIDDVTDYHLRGGNLLKRARVQVDAYAGESGGGDPYDTAADLANQINGDDAGSGLSAAWWDSAISPACEVTGVFRLDRFVSYEAEEQRLVRIRQDYDVHYRCTT